MMNSRALGMHKMHIEHKKVVQRRDWGCCNEVGCMYEEGGRVQHLKWIEDKIFIEWEWCRKHKRQKTRKV
jgi:hypothetical protein